MDPDGVVASAGEDISTPVKRRKIAPSPVKKKAPTPVKKRSLPLHSQTNSSNHRPYPTNTATAAAAKYDEDANPEVAEARTKQQERDFAMVLAAMPHARVPTTDDLDKSLPPPPTAASASASASDQEPTEHDIVAAKSVVAMSANVSSALGLPPCVLPTTANENGNDNNTTTTTPRKHRPYRRSKRPKDYIGLSTITTATPSAQQQENVYDTVMGEADDLLKAAIEAQHLGRLKMASNYLILLHTRLVGLGIKFDRAKVVSPSQLKQHSNPVRVGEMKPEVLFGANSPRSQLIAEEEDDNSKKPAAKSPEQQQQQQQQDEDSKKPAAVAQTPPAKKQPYEPPPSNGVSEAAMHQLKSFLVDQGMMMDQAMVEHLARAAAELHHKRIGKKPTEDGFLRSPVDADKVFHYNKDYKKDKPWNAEEKKKFTAAVAAVGKDAAKIHKHMKGVDRTLEEVKAYLENDQSESPRKRGGRGRKPPTTAMNTVNNASFDVRAMLGGKSWGF